MRKVILNRKKLISLLSAITDHVRTKNHVIDWKGVSIIVWESTEAPQKVRESICIWKREKRMS